MNIASKHLLGVSLLCCALAPAGAVTLTDISFRSNINLSFANDTINNNGTSPLAFTANTGLNQPFLNASDSTLSLAYGNYYAIAFLGFGEHVGPGVISFRVDGGAPVSQAVNFPNPGSPSGVFANFVLPGGDAVTVAATGLSADRIRIVADGGGLQPDGNDRDAFYAFNYTSSVSAVPEPVTTLMFASGLAVLGLTSKRRKR